MPPWHPLLFKSPQPVFLTFQGCARDRPTPSSTLVRHVPVPPLEPAAHLAWEEAALDAVDAGEAPGLLWFWEAPRPFVVVGYGHRIDGEVDRVACARESVPVLRRCSGGGTVVQGPGCLNYGLALPIDPAGPSATISSTNHWIMERQRNALQTLVKAEVSCRGHTDLAVGDRKFSGNAQRRKRCALLFHGTFLLAMDLPLLARCLRPPSAQPDYRGNRDHLDFVFNLHLPARDIEDALVQAWGASFGEVPSLTSRTAELVAQKYGDPAWHERP